ncbi:MAG: hypothetical protein ACR2LH_05300, partial [Thermoleophilaceae bacterium]
QNHGRLAGQRGPGASRVSPETEGALRKAGFEAVDCGLEQRTVVPDRPLEYVTTVCLGHHLEVLPGGLRERFARDVVEACGDPLTLDYRRLNIAARRTDSA